MNFGIIFALFRLNRDKIYCINSNRIAVAARIQLFVLDKTGTLTEEGLSVSKVRANAGNSFENDTEDVTSLCPGNLNGVEKTNKIHLTQCMASCHSIAELEDKSKK